MLLIDSAHAPRLMTASGRARSRSIEEDINDMNRAIRLSVFALTVLPALWLGGCAPEVGSDRWCANLKEKPKGDWSFNEAADYAKHCIIR